MITRIVLENFKCFRKVEVNPRLITVLIGPNGTGKSSVLQALSLLKQSIGVNGLNHQGLHISLPSRAEFIPKFLRESADIRIEFAGQIAIRGLGEHGFADTVDYHYAGVFPPNGRTTSYGEITATFEGDVFEVNMPEESPSEVTVALGGGGARFKRANQVARIFDLAGTTGRVKAGAGEGARIAIDAPNAVLQNIRIVPSIRGLVRHVYREGDNSVEDVVLANGLSSQEDQLATNLGYSRELESALSDLLKRVTGSGLRADHIPPQSLEVKSLTSAGDVNIVAEGFGTNALILLFHQLIKTVNGATIMIEEPEIHLHPRAQAEVASLLAEEATTKDKQLIITTHSEHILGRLLTLVAEKMLSKDQLAIYSFEKDGGGICTAREIMVTEDGRVIGGLPDFFETDLAELDRYVRSLLPSE